MLKVEFNSGSGNPFVGMEKTLEAFQNASKGMKVNFRDLISEAKTSEQAALVFSLLFSVGDITAREHNIFAGNKVDSGGHAQRETFRSLIKDMWAYVVRAGLNQLRFLELVAEYTHIENVIGLRLRTDRKTGRILEIINMPEIYGREAVVEFLAKYYNGTNFQKYLVAKYLTLPKTGRTQSRELQLTKRMLIKAFSDRVKLDYEVKKNYINFLGYRAWRKRYNKDLESVMFSTGKVLDFTQDDFLKWMEHLPAQARFRVKTKLMNKAGEPKKEKYTELVAWFKTFENFKLQKQEEKRVIENALKQKQSGGIVRGTAQSLSDKSEEELKDMLAEVTKEAKVTTGGINFQKLLTEVITGTVDKTKIDPFLDKINLPYNTLVFVDDSGSMRTRYGSRNYPYTPRELGAFLATVCLLKNPDEEAKSLIGLFSNTCRFFGNIQAQAESAPNSLLRNGDIKRVSKPLLNSEESFLANYHGLQSFLNANSTGNGTRVDSVARSIINWVDQNPHVIDQLSNYPVWTFISDGNFNNLGSASASLGALFKLMEFRVGFKPYVLLIDVARTTSQKITNFVGLDNVMMVPPSPANIELFLTNFKDMDAYDVYTPLLSLSRSNRYAPVRAWVAGKTS